MASIEITGSDLNITCPFTHDTTERSCEGPEWWPCWGSWSRDVTLQDAITAITTQLEQLITKEGTA